MKGCCCSFDGIIRDMPGPWTQGQGCGCGINFNWFLFYPSSNVCLSCKLRDGILGHRRFVWNKHRNWHRQTDRPKYWDAQVKTCLFVCNTERGLCIVAAIAMSPQRTQCYLLCGPCCEWSALCWLTTPGPAPGPAWLCRLPGLLSACCYLGPLDGQVRRTAGQNRFLTARLDTNNF